MTTGSRLATAPRSVAIFRALQLGDMLCCVPALRALRSAWPAARVTLIGLPWARTFVDRFQTLIDDLEVFPGAPGFPEQDETGSELPDFLARMRARRFDLAIQLHGSGGPANEIVRDFGAARCAGFLQSGEQRAGIFIPWPETALEPRRYLLLVQALGIAANDDALWLPLDRVDQEEFGRLAAEHRIGSSPFVVVHPGAQLPSRRWPVARFGAVADALAANGWIVVITGSAGEADLARALMACMRRGEAIDLAGRTSLGALAALIARAALVVCNDTGVSHIAAAMRTPSVVIACGSDTNRWAPADKSLHRVIAHYPSCRPCSYRICPYAHECAEHISVATALDAVQSQLVGRLSRPAGNRGLQGARRFAG